MAKKKKSVYGKIKGAVRTDEETKKLYSHDASMFELKPEVVIEPKGIAYASATLQVR